MSNMSEIDAMIEEAREMGARRGKDAAGWTFNGNTDTARYASVLAGMEDGDPAMYDALGAPLWLSGEYAGEPVPMDIVEAVGYAPRSPYVADDEIVQAILDAYEEAADSAYWLEIEAVCVQMTSEA